MDDCVDVGRVGQYAGTLLGSALAPRAMGRVYVETTDFGDVIEGNDQSLQLPDLVPVNKIELYLEGSDYPLARSRDLATLDFDFARSSIVSKDDAMLQVCVDTANRDAIVRTMGML